MDIGRSMVRAWLANFPHQISALHRDAAARAVSKSRMPWYGDALPPAKVIYGAVGDLMFYLATDGQFKKDERTAYMNCVTNAEIFLPTWFNMLLGGRLKERQGLADYYKLREAFARYPGSPALRRVMEIACVEGIELSEALRLIAIVFAVAGAAAPPSWRRPS